MTELMDLQRQFYLRHRQERNMFALTSRTPLATRRSSRTVILTSFDNHNSRHGTSIDYEHFVPESSSRL
jgi:hypothetical protein